MQPRFCIVTDAVQPAGGVKTSLCAAAGAGANVTAITIFDAATAANFPSFISDFPLRPHPSGGVSAPQLPAYPAIGRSGGEPPRARRGRARRQGAKGSPEIAADSPRNDAPVHPFDPQ
ncbi:hypothetical protein GCM10011392_07860 [Wenxinia marina]|nr:hypothetical protein GCM10011392_07860 [Wenxinia marina]